MLNHNNGLSAFYIVRYKVYNKTEKIPTIQKNKKQKPTISNSGIEKLPFNRKPSAVTSWK